MKTQKQIFEKASRIVRTRGLKKGDYGTVDGPVCMLGALNQSWTGDPHDTRNGYALNISGYDADAYITFSDKPSTTADEVADVLWLLGQVAE
jgi:hypothetical protein